VTSTKSYGASQRDIETAENDAVADCRSLKPLSDALHGRSQVEFLELPTGREQAPGDDRTSRPIGPLHHDLDGFAEPRQTKLPHADATRFGPAAVAAATFDYRTRGAALASGSRLQRLAMDLAPSNGVLECLDFHNVFLWCIRFGFSRLLVAVDRAGRNGLHRTFARHRGAGRPWGRGNGAAAQPVRAALVPAKSGSAIVWAESQPEWSDGRRPRSIVIELSDGLFAQGH